MLIFTIFFCFFPRRRTKNPIHTPRVQCSDHQRSSGRETVAPNHPVDRNGSLKQAQKQHRVDEIRSLCV